MPFDEHSSKEHPLVPPFDRSESLHDADIESLNNVGDQLQDLLPASWSPKRRVISIPENDLTSFLHADLDVQRLNDIARWLRIVGHKHNISPLHRSVQKGRRIIPTEQTDLHLTWIDQDLYIKPLPRYLCTYSFWKDYLCHDELLFKRAWGLLRTYLWLVQNESDFDAAVLNKLIRYDNWNRWRSFVQSIHACTGPDTPIDERYIYGELRLRRLNLIYNLLQTRPGRGFYNRYSTYGNFFERNFAWTVTVFLYLTIILTAMQVGATTPQLQGNQIWLNALYGFSTFCVFLPLAVIAIAMITILMMVWSNVVYMLFKA